MVAIKKQLVSSRLYTSRGVNPCNYITIHETANTNRGANAKAHANLQSNGNSRNASWHYQVDDKEIIQSFPDNVKCWHAGDGSGRGNTQSIGIEICVNSDGNYKKAVENAISLVKYLMKIHGISVNNVVQHNNWSGKNCPTNLRNGSKGVTWTQFKNDIVKTTVAPKPPVKPTPPVASVKPIDPKPQIEEEEKLDLTTAQREEIARIFKKARELGIFTSDEHERKIVDGTMTMSRLQYLQSILIGIHLNDGKRIY